MKHLLALAALAVVYSSCRKREEIPPAIPPATTPFSCEYQYFTRLYDKLSADAIYATQRQELLLPFMNHNGTQANQGFWFKKLDTSGNLLWEKRAGTFDGYYGTFFQKDPGTFYVDYLDFSSSKMFVSALVDEDINFLKKTEVAFDGFFKIYKTSDRGTIAYNRDVVKKAVFVDTNCDKRWEYTDDKVQWIFGAEDQDHFYFAGTEHLAEAVENSSLLARGYLVKLNRDGKVAWRQTYSRIEDTLLVHQIFRLRFENGVIKATAYSTHPFDQLQNIGVGLDIDMASGNLLTHAKNPPQDTAKSGGAMVTYTVGDGLLKLANYKPAGQHSVVQLTKYNTAGAEVWKQQYGNTADISGLGVTALPGGSIFILANSHYYDGEEPGSQVKKCLIKADANGATCHD